jgi:EAL domain-containing protein (putative c-di-GMP-specific phosphodiesterase class I)
LNTRHVKIDRDVLHHPFFDTTIKFVRDIVTRDRGYSTPVIVEGFDEESQVSLSQLYNLGIRHVQGYIIGRPSQQIYQLEKEIAQYLEHLLKM